jgi:hypothetical protein
MGAIFWHFGEAPAARVRTGRRAEIRASVPNLFSVDRTLTYTVADLALDEGLALRCDCRVRILGRAELATLVGRDARLHLIGLRRELWCEHCGEPPFHGWVTAAVPSR